MLAPSYLRSPLPACSIVVDRHTHKNGGSTLRDLFLRNELHDGWLYWGYGLAHVERVVEGLLELVHPRALLEHPPASAPPVARRPVHPRLTLSPPCLHHGCALPPCILRP